MVTDFVAIPYIGGVVTIIISILSLNRLLRRDWEKKINHIQRNWSFSHYQMQKDVKQCQKDLHDLSVHQAELRTDVKHIKTLLQTIDRKLDRLKHL